MPNIITAAEQIADFDQILKGKLAITRKDVAQFASVLPATFKRLAEVGAASEEGQQLQIEATAIWHDYADERPTIFGDPYRDERQNLRIFAKRNGLDAACQKLLGVSDGTPDDYDAAWRKKYLGEA